MKALIVSDTHGSLWNFQTVIEKEKPDRVFHLGDSHNKEEEIKVYAGVPVDIVRGNCDGGFCLQDEIVTTVMGKKVFMTHGHYYGVYSGISQIARRGEELGCDIVMYGHTHVPDISYYGKMTIVCPGSLTEPRQERRIPTYAIMENTEEGKIEIKIVELS